MGMKYSHNTFSTNRTRAARRLTGPGKIKLWALTSYAKKMNLEISMLTHKNYKPSVKFTCPREILKLPKNLRCSWPWLKGLWGSTGGLYFPRAGYYLTLIISDLTASEITENILNFTGLSWSRHRNEFTLRNHEDVMTFLCNAGMPYSALKFDDTVMIRSARNQANLARNYDAANIARSVKAAHEQKILAEKILTLGMLEELPDKLREIVELRLLYPDESLEGIGEKLKRKIKKSAVKYRWEKVKKFAAINILNAGEFLS